MVRLVTPIVTPLQCRGKGFDLSSQPDLPPKSHATLSALTVKRNGLIGELGAFCIREYWCYDLPRAKDFLRSYACSFYDLLKEAYSHQIYIWDREKQIADEAVQITIACWDNFNVAEQEEPWDETLRNAIVLHNGGRPLRGDAEPQTQRVNPFSQSNYAASGVDITSGSPLLKMAMTPQLGSPSAYKPLLPLVVTPPKPKRLSAQVDCRPAAALIDKYIHSQAISLTELATKAQTTDRTLRRLRKDGRIHRDILKRLARAMNIGVDKLIG